jgi:hypothetical protein
MSSLRCRIEQSPFSGQAKPGWPASGHGLSRQGRSLVQVSFLPFSCLLSSFYDRTGEGPFPSVTPLKVLTRFDVQVVTSALAPDSSMVVPV